MNPARFDAVVFDLYETLITEFDPLWRPGKTPAERLGISDDVFAGVWRAHQDLRMTRPVDFRDVVREACRAGGRLMDRTVEAVIAELYSERLAAKEAPMLAVEQPVLEALRQLRERGYRLGLLSNCSIEEVAAWPRSPLAPLFDETIFSYHVGYAKPDRTVYLLACQRLGVPPTKTVFVGDGGSDELAGAARAGLDPYCAQWFLSRWPVWRTQQTAERNAGFRQLANPAELVSLLGHRE